MPLAERSLPPANHRHHISGRSIPLAEQSLPTCNPGSHLREEAYHWRNSSCPSANQKLHVREEAYHWRNGLPTCKPQLHVRKEHTTGRSSSCPSANQNYMSGRKHTTGGTVLCPSANHSLHVRGSIPLAKTVLCPSANHSSHLREEAYHWRNSSYPSANHSFHVQRKHTTGETVLAHLQTRLPCPGGSIPLAEQFLPICKPQLCPGGSIPLAERSLPTCNLIYRSRTKILPYYLQLYKAGQFVSRASFWSVSSPCWETNTVPEENIPGSHCLRSLPSGEKTSPVHNHIPHEPQCLYVPGHPISLANSSAWFSFTCSAQCLIPLFPASFWDPEAPKRCPAVISLDPVVPAAISLAPGPEE